MPKAVLQKNLKMGHPKARHSRGFHLEFNKHVDAYSKYARIIPDVLGL